MDEPRHTNPATALVFAGGDHSLPPVAHRLARDALVIGADSGIEHAHALGFRVDVAVGDFDSVAPSALAVAERAGARVDRHARDKDATDLELALDVVVAEGIIRVTVVAGHGGRVDHSTANLLLLGSSRFAVLDLDAWIGTAHVTVVRRAARLDGAPGGLVSLLAVGGAAEGVTTTGLRFPLDDATLLAGSTLGISNELTGETATVSLRAGALLAIQPSALDEERGTT